MRAYAYWRDPLCLCACLCYALNRWGLKPHCDWPFFHGYFNDLLLVPCALPVVLWAQGKLGLRPDARPPTPTEICFHWAVWSVVCEIIGPHLLRVTGDPLDVLAYGAGGVAAGLWWKGRPTHSRVQTA